MPAWQLRDLLRTTVEAYLPAGSLEVAKAAEESEREQLHRWADLIAAGGAP
jgi:hypothetical protein